MKNMATGGSAATTKPAEISCQAASHCPRSEAIPVVMGFTVSLGTKTSAQK